VFYAYSTIGLFVGVVEICVSLFTGLVAIVGMAEADTLGELLAARLRRPVFLLADFSSAPAPPAGGENAVMPPASPPPPAGGGNGVLPPLPPAPPVDGQHVVMPPWWPAPSSVFPAPSVGGGYHPYGSGVIPDPLLPVDGYYNPYVRHNQFQYAAPPSGAGYYYTPFSRRLTWVLALILMFGMIMFSFGFACS
jgi:hypothetical protein